MRKLLPSDEELATQIASVTEEVQRMIADGSAIDRFRGKVILKQFYQRHIAEQNVSYTQTCLELAKRVGRSGKLTARLDSLFDRLVA